MEQRLKDALTASKHLIPGLVSRWGEWDGPLIDHAVAAEQFIVPVASPVSRLTMTAALILDNASGNTQLFMPVSKKSLGRYGQFDFWLAYIAIKTVYPLYVVNDRVLKERVVEYVRKVYADFITHPRTSKLLAGSAMDGLPVIMKMNDMLNRTTPLSGPMFSALVHGVMISETGCSTKTPSRPMIEIDDVHYNYVVPFEFFNELYSELMVKPYAAAVVETVKRNANDILSLTLATMKLEKEVLDDQDVPYQKLGIKLR